MPQVEILKTLLYVLAAKTSCKKAGSLFLKTSFPSTISFLS